MSAGHEPRAYTAERHQAWLKRREIEDDPLRLCHGDVFRRHGRRHRVVRSDAAPPVWNASASVPIGLYDLDPPAIWRSAIWSPSCRTSRSPISWSSAAISVAACR
jgi:hypothetical protein